MSEDMDLRSEAPRGRHGIRGVLAVALAVALVGAGALAVRAAEDDGDDDTPVAADGTNAPEPDALTVPEGLQVVSYHGLEVLFPEDWRLNDARCGTPQGDTVMIPVGAVDLCATLEPPGLTVVEVQTVGAPMAFGAEALATDTAEVEGGGRGRRGRGAVGPEGRTWDVSVLVLPDLGLMVTARGPDLELRERLLDDVRITPVDSNGCPDRVSSLDPPAPSGRADAGRLTVPGAPVSATLCSYEDLWLLSSAPPRSGVEVAALVTLLNGLPDGVSQAGAGFAVGCDIAPHLCERELRRGFVATFRYADGPPVVADIRIGGVAPLSVDTGDRTTKLSLELFEALTRDLRYSGGFPDPREYR